MNREAIEVGFIPLVDCAPLVVAREIGFAEEEGLALELRKAPSWSALRDRLALGALDAAHMLAPVPVAMSLGLGGIPAPLDALAMMSMNGDVIGVSMPLAERMAALGERPGFMDAAAVGRRLIEAAEGRLRLGVPFPFSMHAELLYYWLDALGLKAPQGLDVRTVPPPQMAEAMAAGEIDAFCVGEPWGSVAVETGVAELILPGCAIWRFAPEKVLAVRRGWAEEQPAKAEQLMRAVWRAGRWLADPAHRLAASELLARPDYVNVPSEIIERSLAGRLVVAPTGEERRAPRFVEFFDAAATFPWRSQAVWMATRMAERNGLDRAEAAKAARACFRTDLYRRNLGPAGADLPGASEKLEGALDQPTAVASAAGRMILGPDLFFDGRVFDPSEAA
ncbi:CmpA/NrtA family ABC transporter substrate-binding protein [Albimonas sp. CAU 1670]|uniref:CmpA/NrtA family ABC transporter substrate-binding protein n=1 Tax=Albimonas sp. CAU 1670 TaxID=3032599 RepID=UPI0023DADCF0|nr:CmpA/NrtA family ABC transporter substrate-binding protein [Albimonas sp. CAU 1670]MDF2235491.1 CmpA/NrtA family ABC transporter substrate-binding protein [Albimonas sp. CAU 1670]